MLKRTVMMAVAACILLAGTATLFAQGKADPNSPKKAHGDAGRASQMRDRGPAPTREEMDKRMAERKKKMEERNTWVTDFTKAFGENDKKTMGTLIEKMDKIVEADKKVMEEHMKAMEERMKANEEKMNPEQKKAMEERRKEIEARQAKEAGKADPNAPKTDKKPKPESRVGQHGPRMGQFETWFGQVKEAYKADDKAKIGTLLEEQKKRQQDVEKMMKDRPAKGPGRERPGRPDRNADKGVKADKGSKTK